MRGEPGPPRIPARHNGAHVPSETELKEARVEIDRIQATALRKRQQGVLTEEEYNVVCQQAERNLMVRWPDCHPSTAALPPPGAAVASSDGSGAARARRPQRPDAHCEWSVAEEETWVLKHRIQQAGECYFRSSSAKVVALRSLVRRPDAANVDLRDPLRWQADFPKAAGVELPSTAAAARTRFRCDACVEFTVAVPRPKGGSVERTIVFARLPDAGRGRTVWAPMRSPVSGAEKLERCAALPLGSAESALDAAPTGAAAPLAAGPLRAAAPTAASLAGECMLCTATSTTFRANPAHNLTRSL